MSDPVSNLKQELLAAAERQQRHTVLAPKSGRWPERFRFVPRRSRRLVVVLAAVALATAVTTAGWAIVREVVFHESFAGLPPVGATPSAPENGELVIQYRLDTEDLQRAQGAWRWVYADGRLITADRRLITLRSHSFPPEAGTPWSSGLLEQRLTPEGVELMRSEIVSTGLFEHHEPADSSSSPHNVIQVRIGERLVRVQAERTAASNWRNDFPKRLRERLADPASWLPASAWADRRLRPYVPSRYDVFYGGLIQTVERSSLLPLLPAAAEDLLGSKEAVPRHGKTGDASAGSEYPITRYVSALTTDEARALARALDGARLDIPGTSVDLLPPNKGRGRNSVFFLFFPYLPHGESVCLACG